MIDRFARLFRRERAESECARVRALSSDFIDEELDEESAEKVRAHLKWCDDCEGFFNTLRATIGLLRSSKRQEAPPPLTERIRQRLRREGASTD